jgi:hypothetical protein
MIRRSQDRQELLAPIPAGSKLTVIELLYRW